MSVGDPLALLRDAVRSGADVRAACEAADAAAQSLVGHDLFTVMRFHPEAMEVERLYSSRPLDYPPGGRKQKKDTAWGAHVLGEGRVFHGDGAADIRWAFNDHALILGLGLGSVINAPLKRDGEVIGTMNLLAGPGGLSADDIGEAERIAATLAPAL